MGLLGWVSNFIIGMSYRLFPGFVAHARSAAGYRAVTTAELSIKSPRWAVFLSYNLGVAILVVGFMSSWAGLTRAGAIGIALGGLCYSATTLWTLSFAYRRAIPSAANVPLRVLSS
jgi:hypothetical protein